jgi:hypothetical protein
MMDSTDTTSQPQKPCSVEKPKPRPRQRTGPDANTIFVEVADCCHSFSKVLRRVGGGSGRRAKKMKMKTADRM